MRNAVRVLMLGLVILIGVRIGTAQSVEPILEYGRGLPLMVVWSPDGAQLLVVTQTGTLWRYDARTFETLDSMSEIRSARYSASGDWLFTQSPDDTWAIRSANAPDQVIARGLNWVGSAPGTGWLLTQDISGTAFRPENDPTRIVLGGLTAVYFSPDQQRVITFDPSNGYVLRDVELAPLEAQPDFPDQTVLTVQWSPDGQRLALPTDSDQVFIVPLSADEQPYTLTLLDRARFAWLEWSPDNTRLLDYDSFGNARIWDAENGRLLVDLPSGEPYLTPEELELNPMLGYGRWDWNLYWSADSSHLFRCANPMDTSILCRYYDSRTGEETGHAFGNSLPGSNFTPDKRYFVISSGIFDANTGAVVADFSEAHIGGYNRVFTRDSRRMATGSLWNSGIVFYDLERMQVDHTLNIPPFLYDAFSMAWSPNGERLVTWGSYGVNGHPGSGLITVWDANTGTETGHISGHVQFGQIMAFSSDSSTFAAADNLGNVAVFDTTSGNLLHTLSGHREQVSMMVWQPEGDLLATGTARSHYSYPSTQADDAERVQVWDTATGELVATLEHEQPVHAILWQSSGRYLITDDSTGMSIWDVQTWTREQIVEMSGGDPRVAPSYRSTDNGNVLIRGHSSCSHGGYSLNFFNFTSRHHVGSLSCSGTYNYEWNDAVGGILLSSRKCDYTDGVGYHDCWVDVALISTELPNVLYAGRIPYELEPAYSFGQFAGEIFLSSSPDNTYVVVMTDAELTMWRLGRENAVLLWSGETASPVVWNHRGDALALFSGDAVRIVDAETSSTEATLSGLPVADDYSITWSADDAYLLVTSSTETVVLDVHRDERVPLPEDIQSVHWRHGLLQVYRPSTDINEWWDVRTGSIFAAGDRIPLIVSDDGRLGAGTRAGVLRVWQLGE